MLTSLIRELEQSCRDRQRRVDILAHPELNGIDYVEYEYRPGDVHPHVLVITFLKPLPDAPHSDPDDAYGLTTHLEQIRIAGGRRIVGIKVLDAVVVPPRLEVVVDRTGDFSTYWLSLGWTRNEDGNWQQNIPRLDRLFSLVAVDFKAECPSEFDCRAQKVCSPEPADEPLLDYLTKDYAGFRQLLLDLIAQRNPDWLERNPADLGMALVELLSYAGDHLSYLQDTVANEAYLDTARQRVSAKRHARLIDYHMHDGRNAWSYVHVETSSTGSIPQRTKVLSKVSDPLRNEVNPPDTVLREADLSYDAFEADPALLHSRIYETTFPLEVHPENNTIYLHTWGNRECCLPGGITSAYIYALNPGNPQQVIPPTLQAGDFLIFEEILGPETGTSADADPQHRQAVELVAVEPFEDTVYSNVLVDGAFQVRGAIDPALPLLRITWRNEDALEFPLCVSARTRAGDLLTNISVIRGNIVLADHGRTIIEEYPQSEPVSPDHPFRLRLRQRPLTMQCQSDDFEIDEVSGNVVPGKQRLQLTCQAQAAQPAVAVIAQFPTGEELWTQVPDLLDSSGFARHFVVDVNEKGELRFGDGQYGREPAGATGFRVSYRIGSGRAGNVGAEALAHAVQPVVAPTWPTITAIRNPLPAEGGEDQEAIEQVRQKAPAAFRAQQFRAVTEADYKEAALRMDEVAGAVAAFRWTGSWYTVLLGIDPRNSQDLITESGGRTHLMPEFSRQVRNFITRYRLAGYDLEIRSGEYIPLEINLDICVAADHFRGDVLQAVEVALSDRINPDGSRGFFHPDNFTFGGSLYLSQLYAAVEAVDGVNSAVVRTFRKYGEEDNGELEAGVMPIGTWQIARLDNDPDFRENGVLRFNAGGGK